MELWFGNWIEIQRIIHGRAEILNFSLNVQFGVLRVSTANELDIVGVEHEKGNSISPRIFSVVEIPIKFFSLYSKSYFLCFITSKVTVLQEVPTTWTQARKSVSSNLKLACGTKIQSCLIFIRDYCGA